jgi:hypothetical protein
MSVTTQVLFGLPQQEMASLIRDRFSRCKSAFLVSGFMTVEGMEAIATPIRAIYCYEPTILARNEIACGSAIFQSLDSVQIVSWRMPCQITYFTFRT